jgi:Bacterial Ig domain/NHL repeat
LKWGSQGTSDGQFSSPIDVAVDTSGSVFVVDNDNFRIQKFVDETIPPTVTITRPANGSTFIAPATETINADAIDNLGIKQVEFYMNNTLLGSDNSSPYSITLTDVPIGVYSLTAKAIDIADNTKTSTPLTVNILQRK